MVTRYNSRTTSKAQAIFQQKYLISLTIIVVQVVELRGGQVIECKYVVTYKLV